MYEVNHNKLIPLCLIVKKFLLSPYSEKAMQTRMAFFTYIYKYTIQYVQ